MRLWHVTLLLPLLLGACGSVEEHLALAETTDRPLAFDPTSPAELGLWWTNGRELLALHADGQYTLWAGQNRHHPPRERGAWSRTSFAELRLTPYGTRGPTSYRVPIDKPADQLTLALGDGPLFTQIQFAPRTIEDVVVGAWASDDATLVLRAGGAYDLRPRGEMSRELVARVGHRGQWYVADGVVRLESTAPNIGPFRVVIETDSDTVWLEAGGQVFRRSAVSTPDSLF